MEQYNSTWISQRMLSLAAVLALTVLSISIKSTTASFHDVELPPKMDNTLDSALESSAESPPSALTTSEHGRLMIDWLRAKGGYVNPKLEIRRADPSDESSHYGMFSTEAMEENELLLSIPQQCLITSEMEEPDWICTTTQNLVREMKLGNASAYAPYVNYLNSQPYGQLPSHWSDPAKYLLRQVVGQPGVEILPPSDPAGWIDDEWVNECNGGDDLFEQHAFLLVTQRGWDDLLIPVYDMMSHRNGEWLNTKCLGVRQEIVEVLAKKPIGAGDEIFTSYDQCEDCGGRANSYGTAEIFRDYGFVELYPQRWHFVDQAVSFVMDLNEDNLLQLEFLTPEPDEDELVFFEEQIARLIGLMEGELSVSYEGLPEHELHSIREFTQAMITAMESLVSVVKGMDCSAPGKTCRVSPARYSPLDEPYTDYDVTTCDRGISLDYSEYETIEEIQSHYQYNTFIKHPETHNVCFDLDDIYQQCTSYRPHYHEVFTHYTARFLPEVKRVLWVGGGDSMLLHEILKYESLELAIGLELDQTVTRWSFKPHWDNDKVQWWYGDAAKSLLMLPKEYFATFDLVLVDLSETVMSNLVTKELDIMGALSLLLKPEGIFVKNELYFERLNSLFKYTIQINYYDVPAICSQSMVFGSNTVDFIKTKLTDHNVETLFTPMGTLDEKFEIVHDYMQNPAATRYCAPESEEEPSAQEASPGIVLVLEAENATGEISSPDSVNSAIVSSLETQGMHLESTITLEEKGVVSVAMMREGYIVARTFPEIRYVAFDIHLWSSFDKIEGVKNALLAAVGSDVASSSSFRIVASGMFGVASWKQDTMSRGPKFTQVCNDTEQEQQLVKEPMISAVSNKLLTTVARSWLQQSTPAILVVCGAKNEVCESIEAFASEGFEAVVPIFTCPNIETEEENPEQSAILMYACEQGLITSLDAAVSERGRFEAVVLDPSAPLYMGQIVHRILSRTRLAAKYLPAGGPVVLALLNDTTHNWRRMFVDSFRRIYEFSPADVANLVFNSTDSSVELALFVTHDEDFIVDANQLVLFLEEEYDVEAEIRFIGGGRFKWQGDDWQPSQFFLPDGSYDQIAPMQQWNSQEPVGHQSIIQLEVTEGSISVADIKGMVAQTLSTMEIDAKAEEFPDLGDGSVLAGVWPAGTFAVLFDGRSHVSINIFTFEQDPKFAKQFSDTFGSKAMDGAVMNVILYDEMPRGHGRVVNWSRDIGARETPAWAFSLYEES